MIGDKRIDVVVMNDNMRYRLFDRAFCLFGGTTLILFRVVNYYYIVIKS